MHFTQASIPGVWTMDPDFHEDERGRFFRAWCSREFGTHGINFLPVQTNMGYSLRKGTVRGMHFQVAPALEAKLVRCSRGAMFDVALDLRPDSPTYGQSFGAELTEDNGRSLYIPENCAHGYQTLQDSTEMYYMSSAFYDPQNAVGVRFDDPAFGIEWPETITVVSQQDRNWSLVERPTR